MLKDFMEAYPHIEVEGIHIPSDYTTKITAMVAAGEAPDVGQLDEGLAMQWAEEGAVLDLMPFIDKDPDVSIESRLPMTWYWYDGGQKTMGPNLAVEVIVLFYNKDISTKPACRTRPPNQASGHGKSSSEQRSPDRRPERQATRRSGL